MTTRKTIERYLLWSAMQDLGEFCVRDLVERISTPALRTRAWEYCKALHTTGYLELTGTTRSPRGPRSVVYRLIKNTGPEPPRIENELLFDPNLNRPEPYTRLWSVMKILSIFSVNELELCASLEDEIKRPQKFISHYVRKLFLAGYLQSIDCNKSRATKYYRLRRNTGPVAPLVIADGTKLFDPNTKTFYDIYSEVQNNA